LVIKVGCCGYPVSMTRYYQSLSLVELNNTFYKYPRLSTVEGWRNKAPQNFEFTVKAHQDISHNYKLRFDAASSSFEKMKEICSILKSKILLIQTPASFSPDLLSVAADFFSKVEKGDLILVWETRGPKWESQKVREDLRKVLEELEIPHVTDPFKVMPVYAGSVAYFRLHGLGKRMYYYQYSDDELISLREKIKVFNSNERTVYVLFNNLSMFEDALRFKSLIEKGSLPSLTGATGINSIRTVIQRARYPLTKSRLIAKLGWRLFEVHEGVQMRLEKVLRSLPQQTYRNPDEIIETIKRMRLLD